MTDFALVAPEAPAEPAGSARLRHWQRVMIALMVVGYAGYYVCRSDLSVATPLIIKEYSGIGIGKEAIGWIVSLGTIGYALGKFINGSLADFLGGRKMFLTGMGGAIAFTVLFGLAGGMPLFTLAWIGNRLIQSTGWVGMVKMTGRWYAYSTYGAVMGVISLSFLFGDVGSRLFMGELINLHVGWRGVFFAAAAVLGIIFIANLLFLKESPHDIDEPEPEANPANAYGEAGHSAAQEGVAQLLMPLLRNWMFWTVCALSFGFTLLRETFNTWTPQYLTEIAGMSAGNAGMASSIFPFLGGVSTIIVGVWSDRLGRSGRAMIILVGLLLTAPALVALARLHPGASSLAPLMLIGFIAFVMLGPYSFLAGAVSLDLGGKRGSATACGWIDGVGYVGGILAGEGVAAAAHTQGWSGAFMDLAGMTVLSCVAAGIYLWGQRRSAQEAAA